MLSKLLLLGRKADTYQNIDNHVGSVMWLCKVWRVLHSVKHGHQVFLYFFFEIKTS